MPRKRRVEPRPAERVVDRDGVVHNILRTRGWAEVLASCGVTFCRRKPEDSWYATDPLLVHDTPNKVTCVLCMAGPEAKRRG